MQIDWSKIFSYIIGEANSQIVEEVETWRKDELRNEEFYHRVTKYYREGPLRNENFSEKELEGLYIEMERTQKNRQRYIRLRQLSVAASLVLLLSVGWWLYSKSISQRQSIEITMMDSDIGRKVIVITGDGVEYATDQLNSNLALQVTPNQLNYAVLDLNILSADPKEIPTHTIVVPRGEFFELILADSTFVLLTPMSELTYPIKFDNSFARQVTLRGEAFFDVTKSSQPFLVNTDKMRVQVYGTSFNVFAHEEEFDETVLVNGKIGITPLFPEGAEETILHPGESSKIDNTGNIKIEQVDLAEYIAKKDGYILFNGKTIRGILQTLELYYNVNFDIGDLLLDNKEYVCSIKRGIPLKEALSVIEIVLDIKFNIEGKEVEMITE